MKRDQAMPVFPQPKVALVVHRDLAMISALQQPFTDRGYTVVVARDLPVALLAVTQHHLNAALVSSHIAENGDGFPLAGIIQRIFPEAQVSVLARSVDVPELLAAINHGVRKLVDFHSGDAEFLVGSTLSQSTAV